PTPTTAGAVHFTVTFTEGVFGVTASDFKLATNGVSGTSIAGVSGSGSTYTVTVNTGAGNGDIGLKLVDDDSIIDIDVVPLGGTGLGNGNFTGEVYAVCKTPPSITCPGPVAVQCASAVPPANTGSVTASSSCGGLVTVTYESDVISNQTCPNKYTITRTYKATDSLGNVATCTQTITVNDNTAPVITATGTTLALGCNPTPAQINAALGTATATDNCSSVTPNASDSAVTSSSCSRPQTRTWTAADACGDSATPVSRIVTWTVDITAPTISATGSTLTLGCNPTAAQIDAALGSATAADTCSSVTPSASDSAVTSSSCSRSQTRTWMAADACGNIATPVSRIVTWTVDTTKPVLTVPTTGLALGCNPTAFPDDASVTAASSATDTCSTPTINTIHTDTPTGCLTTRDFTVTATDGCNNACSKHVVYTWT